ncbi:MAG: 4Fe-4S binding protein [Bacteroidales bacterium]|nr:4Fe-4S binding protein [Bacteroidales bacterium]
MQTATSLPPVIKINEALCVNCHVCISVCPVKYCNDGSGDFVTINPNTCIGCGKCIEACTHEARTYIDDFQKFVDDLIAGEKIIAVSAPSSAASFPDAHLKLNTFLKELGVAAVFDVSFGAELTVKSYIEHIKNNNPKTVIAQPCPAIVTYIELYKPEL